MPELQGENILYREWAAEPSAQSPKAVFLLVHGLGAHSARWEFLANRKVFKKIAFADKTLIEYPEMLHALSLDIGRENVFRDIIDWADQRL